MGNPELRGTWGWAPPEAWLPRRTAHLAAPHPRLQRELKAVWAFSGDPSAVCPSGRRDLQLLELWFGQSAPFSLHLLDGRAKFLGQETGCFLDPLPPPPQALALPAPSVGLAPGGPSLQLPKPGLGAKAWAAHIPTSITCPSQGRRTRGRTGALRTPPFGDLPLPQEQFPKVPGTPFPC